MYYLYVKIHNVTRLKYLGQTVQSNVHQYKGSGKRWNNHIKKHGYDVTTIILAHCEDHEELKRLGLFYSRLWDIIASRHWANLKFEEGDGGFSHINSLPKTARPNYHTIYPKTIICSICHKEFTIATKKESRKTTCSIECKKEASSKTGKLTKGRSWFINIKTGKKTMSHISPGADWNILSSRVVPNVRWYTNGIKNILRNHTDVPVGFYLGRSNVK